jgi:hypothetical protein
VTAHDGYLASASQTGADVLRCGTICRDSFVQAKAELIAYLEALRASAKDMFKSYYNLSKAYIDSEYAIPENLFPPGGPLDDILWEAEPLPLLPWINKPDCPPPVLP